MAGPGNILIRVGAEAGQAISELGRVNHVMGDSMTRSEKMGATLKKAAVPATIALTAIAVGSKKAVDAASNLNEVVNKSEVIFGSSGKSVVAWSKHLAASFGLSSREALEAASNFGNMLVPMGYSRKEAAKTSKAMVELAGDMASFNNASPEETLAALESGLAGQSEPLRKFGVFLSQDRIEAEAVAKGLVKATVSAGDFAKAQAAVEDAHKKTAEALKDSGKGSVEYQKAQANVVYQEEKLKKVMDGKVPALNAQQKAAASLSLVMKDTADTQGDFARTGDSAANQARIQAAETENLSAALGQGLLPYYQAGQKLLIEITQATSEHTGVVKILVGVVATLSAGILAANVAFKAWTTVSKLAKAATVAYTIAQRALNIVMAMNPIGLAVAALALLVAGFIIAYKKSETFRDIVDGAMKVVKTAIGKVGDAFDTILKAAKAAFGWITDHWKIALFAFGPVGVAVKLLADNFDKVKSAAKAAFDAITNAIASVTQAVKDLIGWIGKIKVPKISLPHIGKAGPAGAYYMGGGPAVAGYAAAGPAPVTINFYGPTDPEGAAREISRVLRAHEVRQGRAPMRAG